MGCPWGQPILVESRDMETLKEKTTRGLFWGGMNNVVQQGLGICDIIPTDSYC